MYKQTALEKRGGNFNGCSLIYISMCKKLTHHQMPQWGQQKKNMSKAPVSHHCVLVPARFRRCFHVWWHHIESIRDRCKERDGNPCWVYLQTPPLPPRQPVHHSLRAEKGPGWCGYCSNNYIWFEGIVVVYWALPSALLVIEDVGNENLILSNFSTTKRFCGLGWTLFPV